MCYLYELSSVFIITSYHYQLLFIKTYINTENWWQRGVHQSQLCILSQLNVNNSSFCAVRQWYPISTLMNMFCLNISGKWVPLYHMYSVYPGEDKGCERVDNVIIVNYVGSGVHGLVNSLLCFSQERYLRPITYCKCLSMGRPHSFLSQKTQTYKPTND